MFFQSPGPLHFHYGSVRAFLDVDIAHCEEQLHVGNVNWRTFYNLCLFDCGIQLKRGAQDQIYSELPMERVFQHSSTEEFDVIKLLIGVVGKRTI